MILLEGQLITVNRYETKEKKRPYRCLQVLTNGGKRASLIDVYDYDMRLELKVGTKISVHAELQPYTNKSGQAQVKYFLRTEEKINDAGGRAASI